MLHQPGAANEETGSNQQGNRERYLGRQYLYPAALEGAPAREHHT